MGPAAEFDYIIVGAGSAGCLLANRLSANPDHRVLLIEAGGKDDWFWIKIPVGYLYTIANPRTDWCFTTEPDPGLAGRSILYARGRVIGGCSSINAMIHMRGHGASVRGIAIGADDDAAVHPWSFRQERPGAGQPRSGVACAAVVVAEVR
jgi:choline dehydrogenase